MSGDSTPASLSSLDTALDLMERALTMLVALKQSDAAHHLWDAIEAAMNTPEGRPLPGEIWGGLYDLPHLVIRTFLLHRVDGLTIEQVTRRLGITLEEAQKNLAMAMHEVSTPRPSGRLSQS